MTQVTDFTEAASAADGMQPIRVLVIEADSSTAAVSCRALVDAGMEVSWAKTGVQAIALARSFRPQIALVDLELPDTHDVQLVRWLARYGDCGVIVVTGYVPYVSSGLCLQAGADDFIAKPACPRDLVARIRALQRRVVSKVVALLQPDDNSVAIGSARLNLRQRRVTDSQGHRIEITGAEFAVLQTLVEAHGKPVSRSQLSETALRRPWRAEDRSIDQLVLGLRKKIAPDGDDDKVIHSVRGAGYLIPEAA